MALSANGISMNEDAMGSAARNEFDATVQATKFQLHPKVIDALRADLTQRDFEVTVTPIKQDYYGNYSSQDLATVQADALLGIEFVSVGYQQDFFASGYGPVAVITVRLILPKTGQKIFQQFYWYGLTDNGGRSMKPLIADSKFTFTSYDALLNDTGRATGGISALAPLLAKAVAAEIAQ